MPELIIGERILFDNVEPHQFIHYKPVSSLSPTHQEEIIELGRLETEGWESFGEKVSRLASNDGEYKIVLSAVGATQGNSEAPPTQTDSASTDLP